jgi:hypothetical protein
VLPSEFVGILEFCEPLLLRKTSTDVRRPRRQLAVVAVILAACHFSQILEPFVTGRRYVQVDLLNPGLLVLEVVMLAPTFAWMCVGVLNYLFYTRVSRQIKTIRALEKEMEKGIIGD